jgi:IclR family transcriptional regulator, KDG regulon repressor
MRESSQTLSRGLKLLDLIAGGREGVAVRELAAAMALPKSIVQRLLYSLEQEGYLARHPSQVGYRLTLKVWSLGCAAVRRIDVRDVARPSLEELAAKTDETVKIGVLDGADVVYVDSISSPQIVRAYLPVGGRAPASSVATGKAIVAFVPETRGHADAPAALTREFEQIRKRGYAINRGEWEADVGALAAPIFDARGAAVASVGAIMPLSRLTAQKATQLAALITEAAAQISSRMGHAASREAPKLKRAS